MTYENKVLWTEGMFLRPHHMQQQDRFYDFQQRTRTRLLHPYYWGISRLEIDRQLLAMGTLAITRCEGILPDGTLFNVDSSRGDRLLIQADQAIQNTLVYLALPIVLAGSDEAELDENSDSLTRFVRYSMEVKDSNLGHSKLAHLNTAKLRLQLLLDHDLSHDYTAIPVLQIRDMSPAGNIELDDGFIPPLVTIYGHDTPANTLNEVIGLLSHRSEAMAQRLTSERAGTSQVADFMLLQLVNRYQGQLRHLQQQKQVHPETVFALLLALYSEMSTFTHKEKRLTSWPAYLHDDLRTSFQQIIDALRQSLSLVFEQTAIAIPLQERRYGVQVAPLPDQRLLDDACFVLGVKCEWSKEVVATRIPTVTKAGGVEQLRDLVNLQLPGIPLDVLTVAPSQIPYRSGYTYFQLRNSPENWAHLKKSGGIAFHFSGEIAGLELELWAIKE